MVNQGVHLRAGHPGQQPRPRAGLRSGGLGSLAGARLACGACSLALSLVRKRVEGVQGRRGTMQDAMNMGVKWFNAGADCSSSHQKALGIELGTGFRQSRQPTAIVDMFRLSRAGVQLDRKTDSSSPHNRCTDSDSMLNGEIGDCHLGMPVNFFLPRGCGDLRLSYSGQGTPKVPVLLLRSIQILQQHLHLQCATVHA